MVRIVLRALPRNCESRFNVKSRLIFLVDGSMERQRQTYNFSTIGDPLFSPPLESSSFIDAGVRDCLDVNLSVSQE